MFTNEQTKSSSTNDLGKLKPFIHTVMAIVGVERVKRYIDSHKTTSKHGSHLDNVRLKWYTSFISRTKF